jgi:hypothetical protein
MNFFMSVLSTCKIGDHRFAILSSLRSGGGRELRNGAEEPAADDVQLAIANRPASK